MRKIILIAALMVMISGLSADEISLNFFIHPQFTIDNMEAVDKLQQATIDSCMSINVYAGELFKPALADSLVLKYMSQLPGMLFSPNDFLHYHQEKFPSFGLLAANIESDSVTTLKKFVIKVDTLRIGIFSIYSPDWAVKNQLADGVDVRADVFAVAKEQVKKLRSSGCDQIIMLTSLSKYVVSYLVKEIDIDAVVNFDYMTTKNTMMGDKEQTGYYYINSESGKYGRLKIKSAGKAITTDWQELSWENAGSGR
ncbi:MAG: hypothetical protein RAO94_12125 [Candidatus Stygibacter australis]|nr:hypothetical protein [Candidatus Stygibacter australis]MDP8323089.1 hypothetical protein [Candidatus Stygibacter australis]